MLRFQQYIVGKYNGCLAGCFEHGADVLHKVKLLVAGGPEVLPVVGQVFFLLFAFFVGKGLTALFIKGWIG